MTPYKYFVSGSSALLLSPRENYINAYQAFIDEQFYNSTTAYTIQEETVFSSGSYVDVEVRVNKVINATTGEKLGDDFKLIIFKDLQHASGIGVKYFFSDSYWLVINSEIIKNVTASCTIRRCNNILRWMDADGNLFSEPCAIEYKMSGVSDDSRLSNPVIPSGYIQVYAQLNDRTKKIKGNQRFLFGSSSNRICYKVQGNGVRNFLNQQTMDDESGKLLMLQMEIGYVNDEVDDLVNGIADANEFDYLLSISPSSISGSAGNTYQLIADLTLNGISVDKPLTYRSSASPIATVTGSGLVTLVSSGSCYVSGCMVNNNSASANVLITVSGSSGVAQEIRIDPTPTFILEKDTITYNCYLYLNGVIQANTFVFIAGSAVSTDHYTMTSTGNSVTISNDKKYLLSPLTIDCTSGSYTRQIEIALKGSW
jgi:hypothetical protein